MHSDLIVSQTDGRPMYLQIMQQIKERIKVGDWQTGQEIPSIRQLSADLRVSVITVKRAYLELEREGIIFTQHGKGSRVAQTNLQPQLYTQELETHLQEVARLGTLLGLETEELLERLRTYTQ
jgi:GntR family transcriptional regulator